MEVSQFGLIQHFHETVRAGEGGETPWTGLLAINA